jgi:hypothetical protein
MNRSIPQVFTLPSDTYTANTLPSYTSSNIRSNRSSTNESSPPSYNSVIKYSLNEVKVQSSKSSDLENNL